MGNVFPSVRLGITSTATTDAEAATAPAPPVGDRRYPSALCVPAGSSSTRASVWRPVGRDCTPRTTPATIATRPVDPAWDLWLRIVSDASNLRKLFSLSLVIFCMESAPPDVPHTASWTTGTPAQSVTPPAGSVLGHLQTTVHPVPPRPTCTRADASPTARKASLSRTASAKHATRPAGPAPAPPRPTAPRAPRRPLCRAGTAGPTARMDTSSTPPLESASGAVQTVSAARLTSRRASAASVCGVTRPGLGFWAITASLIVLRAITPGTGPA